MNEVTDEKMEQGRPIVLIVDDEFSIRDLLSKFLTAKGISCLTAASVEEAIGLLQTRRVDLVLLDWGLRGQQDADGALVLQFCKANLPSLPVVVISGQIFDPGTNTLVDEADGFLQKPFDLTTITDHISRWVNRKKVPADE